MYLSANIVSIEDEEDNEIEIELMKEIRLKKRTMNPANVKNHSDKQVSYEDHGPNTNTDNSITSSDDDNQPINKNTMQLIMEEKNKTNDKDDEDTDSSNKNTHNNDRRGGKKKPIEDNEIDVVSSSNSNDDEESVSDDSTYVPDNYFFHSYFAYCVWGPFASMEKQLPLFLLGKYG